MARRVTIEEIARHSNASPTTVSLVLRNKPGIGIETRHRVMAAAKALGYQRRERQTPDLEGLAAPTRNVGLIFRSRSRSPRDLLPGVNAFYSWVMIGVEAAARAHGMNLLFATLPVDDDNRTLDLPHLLLRQSLDGILLIGSFSAATADEIVGPRSAPVVLVDAPAGAHRYDAVVSDNEGGAYAATRYLIDRGHRRIAFGGPRGDADPNYRQRRDGYVRALREEGLRPIERSDVADLLHEHPDVTALFGANDAFALDAMRAAQALGRNVPDDLSMVGFDDIEVAAQTSPALTTLAVDKVSMGRLAVDALAFRLAWPDAARMVTTLEPTLLPRESVATGPAGEHANQVNTTTDAEAPLAAV